MDLQALRARHPAKTVTAGGLAWEVVDTGSAGPAVLMLPGAQGSAEVFGAQLLALGGRLRLIALGLPDTAEAEALADGLAALMDALALPAASIAASSFGAHVAQVFAHRHPARVRKLLLGNSFPDPTPYQAPDKLASARDTPAEALKQQALDRLASQPDSPLKALLLELVGTRQSAAQLKARMLGLQLARPVPPLGIPAARVTLIECDNDPLVAPPVREAMRARFPGSAAHVIAGGGHYPYVVQPDDYNRILEAAMAAP